VLIWSEVGLSQAYNLGQKIEDTQVNGYNAQVYWSDPGILYYIFQHSTRPDLWIILGDYVTQFPDREEAARLVGGMFETFVSTITFQ
jgi:hypothetical protein